MPGLSELHLELMLQNWLSEFEISTLFVYWRLVGRIGIPMAW